MHNALSHADSFHVILNILQLDFGGEMILVVSKCFKKKYEYSVLHQFLFENCVLWCFVRCLEIKHDFIFLFIFK